MNLCTSWAEPSSASILQASPQRHPPYPIKHFHHRILYDDRNAQIFYFDSTQHYVSAAPTLYPALHERTIFASNAQLSFVICFMLICTDPRRPRFFYHLPCAISSTFLVRIALLYPGLKKLKCASCLSDIFNFFARICSQPVNESFASRQVQLSTILHVHSTLSYHALSFV